MLGVCRRIRLLIKRLPGSQVGLPLGDEDLSKLADALNVCEAMRAAPQHYRDNGGDDGGDDDDEDEEEGYRGGGAGAGKGAGGSRRAQQQRALEACGRAQADGSVAYAEVLRFLLGHLAGWEQREARVANQVGDGVGVLSWGQGMG